MSLRLPLHASVRAPRAQRIRALPSYYSTKPSEDHHAKPAPQVETFDKTARPGLYYPRPQRERDLPPLQVRPHTSPRHSSWG